MFEQCVSQWGTMNWRDQVTRELRRSSASSRSSPRRSLNEKASEGNTTKCFHNHIHIACNPQLAHRAVEHERLQRSDKIIIIYILMTRRRNPRWASDWVKGGNFPESAPSKYEFMLLLHIPWVLSAWLVVSTCFTSVHFTYTTRTTKQLNSSSFMKINLGLSLPFSESPTIGCWKRLFMRKVIRFDFRLQREKGRRKKYKILSIKLKTINSNA